MNPQFVPQILTTDKDAVVVSKGAIQNYYEAKLLFIVLFGFGVIDAVLRCGIQRV